MSERTGFFDLVVDRPVTVLMFAIGMAVFGLVSMSQLPVDLMPEISYPTLTVRTEYEGAAPQEVEHQISRQIESSLSTTDGLVEIESRSRAGLSDVILEFDWDTDIHSSSQSVRESLQTMSMPQGASKPLILRYDPSLEPIMRIALSMESASSTTEDFAVDNTAATLARLRDYADETLRPMIESVNGVAAVRIGGGLESEIHVEVDHDHLIARGLSIEQVRQTLSSENVNMAGGLVRDGNKDYLLRVVGELTNLEEIRAISIPRGDGYSVPLRDVASVSHSYKERDVVTHLRGYEAVELKVFREAAANMVEASRDVKQLLVEVEEVLPPNMRTTVLDDSAVFIEAAMGNLSRTAWLGGVLAIVVLFFFLGSIRASSIIATAIPLSVIVTFAPLYTQGVSLNMMSLGGLALGIGMLVDNAVVVLEAITVHVEAGKSNRDSAVAGVREVAAAVTASTLTTVAVFLPIVFVEGVAGQLFGDLAMTVVVSLLASLVVALVFIPMLAAREVQIPKSNGISGITQTARFVCIKDFRDSFVWLREKKRRYILIFYFLIRLVINLIWSLVVSLWIYPAAFLNRVVFGVFRGAGGPSKKIIGVLIKLFDSCWGALSGAYPNLLRGALRRPGTVVTGAVLALLLSLVGLANMGSELLPNLSQGRFTIETSLPVGTPLSENLELVSQVEDIANNHPDIATAWTVIGAARSADTRSDEGPHTARVLVELEQHAVAYEERVKSELRASLSEITGLNQQIRSPVLFSFRTPIEVIIQGENLPTLQEVSDLAVAALDGVDGLNDVQSSLSRGFPELRVVYRRELLERHGLTASGVASSLRNQVQGVAATRIRRGNRTEDLLVRLQEGDRSSSREIENINVNPLVNPPIPLSSVADLEPGVGPSEIRRIDQVRVVVVEANLTGFDLASGGERVSQALSEVDWPTGVTWKLAGQQTEMDRSTSSMKFAIGMAVFLVYIIMASTFESLVHPFVILMSLPLALVGVVLFLLPLGVPLSVVVMIGLIVLAGVVVNNAIVLVDTINRLRASGLALVEAIEKASAMRLRPIIITTATTVLGLLPLALGGGQGGELQQPLALTLISGLLVSTLLTLVVIPVVYQSFASILSVEDKERSPGAV